KNHVLIFNWLFDVAASRPPLPARFHRELTESLNRGKIETADKAMRSHVRYGIESIVAALGDRETDVPFQRVKEVARSRPLTRRRQARRKTQRNNQSKCLLCVFLGVSASPRQSLSSLFGRYSTALPPESQPLWASRAAQTE